MISKKFRISTFHLLLKRLVFQSDNFLHCDLLSLVPDEYWYIFDIHWYWIHNGYNFQAPSSICTLETHLIFHRQAFLHFHPKCRYIHNYKKGSPFQSNIIKISLIPHLITYPYKRRIRYICSVSWFRYGISFCYAFSCYDIDRRNIQEAWNF